MPNGRRDRIPLSFSDIGKLAVAGIGVAAAWTAVVQIKRVVDFLVGRPESVPFEPNDTLVLKMVPKGLIPIDPTTGKSKQPEFQFLKDTTTRQVDTFEKSLPFTRFNVAKRIGPRSLDFRKRGQVTVRMALEFPAFTSRKRKQALAGLAEKNAKKIFGNFKDIRVAIESVETLPEFPVIADEGEAQVSSLFSPV